MCPGITDDDEDEGVTWTAGTNQWDVQTAQTAGHWGSAGTNWIVQNEGTASTNAFLVSQNLGTSANPIKLRIIAKNNVNLRGSNNFITCPSCTDHTGTCIRTDDPKSAGFAVWTPYGHCYLDNADKWVGDVACRTVMIGAGAGTDCMIADIWGTSQCNGGGGDFDCGAWYSDANVLGETCFQNSQGNVCGQPGICVDPGITVVGDLISHGDIQVRGTATQNVFADKIIASNVGADNSTATRPSVCTYTAKLYADDFIFSAGTLNLTGDNGSRTQSNLYARKVYSLGNIKMWKDHEIRGSDPTGAFGPANDADVYVAGNFDFSSSLIYVHGRMVVGGDFAADSKKIVIRNDGVSAGVTASVTVEEDNIWMEVPW